MTVGRNRPGGSGRMASAGGSRTARRTAPQAPMAAAARLTPMPTASPKGLTDHSKCGK